MKKLLVVFLAIWMVLPGLERPWRDLVNSPFEQPAFADDDDDDDDSDSGADTDDNGDDDDNDGGQGRGNATSGRAGSPQQSLNGDGAFFAPLRRFFSSPRQPANRNTSPRPAANIQLPQFASAEIIVFNISPEDLQNLLNSGFDILEERGSPGGLRSYRLRPPGNTTLEDARDAVRALPSGGNADFNHFYRPDRSRTQCDGQHCAAFRLISWAHAADTKAHACSSSIRLGMVDTGINENHPVFKGASLTVLRLAEKDLPASRASHGTAVAAMLVGQPDTRVQGLLPGAELVAIDAFHRFGKDQRTDAFTLVDALYKLAAEDVSVINLSLSGPENSVLSAAIENLVMNLDVALTAAAGNRGPNAPPAFPAASQRVLAVTAVDATGRIYRRANRGAYIDIAAPGVNVWSAASVKGAKWKTGTSFAVPFASAALALVRSQQPDLSAQESYDFLKAKAKDLGEDGPDNVYGAGLLSANGLCGT
eukprot:g1364.t1